MSTFARTERAALCDTLLDLGPDSPTLDEGWVARDLAAHLVLREGRPDAFPGIVLPPLQKHTAAVQSQLAALPWPVLVERFRSGPPRWSPLGWGPLHEEANLMEFFVHHEDVRRGGVGWSPRELDPGMEQALWVRLRRMAPVLARRAPSALTLRRTPGSDSVTMKAKKGAHVTVSGPVPELVLYAYGRDSAARVQTEGDPSETAQLPGTLGL